MHDECSGFLPAAVFGATPNKLFHMCHVHPMENPKVSIIISNCQGMEFLPECLESLRKQTYKNYEVIIVDAGSTDGSRQYVVRNFPEIKLVSHERIGLGKAINIGIRNAGGDIICFDLNTDENVFENWLEELVQKLKQHDFNIITGTTRLIYGTNLIDEAGVNMNYWGVVKKNGHGKHIDTFHFKGTESDFVGTPTFHRKILKTVGTIDEGYYIYGEDLDFCHRAAMHGIRTFSSDRARSFHHIRGTMGKDVKRNEYFLRRAHIRFQLIHSDPLRLMCSILITAVVLPFAAFTGSIFCRNKSETYFQKLLGRAQAVLWNVKNISETLNQRRKYYRIQKLTLKKNII